MADYEIWEPLQCKSVFNTYLSLGRSNQKVEESGLVLFWPFARATAQPTDIGISSQI